MSLEENKRIIEEHKRIIEYVEPMFAPASYGTLAVYAMKSLDTLWWQNEATCMFQCYLACQELMYQYILYKYRGPVMRNALYEVRLHKLLCHMPEPIRNSYVDLMNTLESFKVNFSIQVVEGRTMGVYDAESVVDTVFKFFEDLCIQLDREVNKWQSRDSNDTTNYFNG